MKTSEVWVQACCWRGTNQAFVCVCVCVETPMMDQCKRQTARTRDYKRLLW